VPSAEVTAKKAWQGAWMTLRLKHTLWHTHVRSRMLLRARVLISSAWRERGRFVWPSDRAGFHRPMSMLPPCCRAHRHQGDRGLGACGRREPVRREERDNAWPSLPQAHAPDGRKAAVDQASKRHRGLGETHLMHLQIRRHTRQSNCVLHACSRIRTRATFRATAPVAIEQRSQDHIALHCPRTRPRPGG
jgi:hypothetical protein